jgi:hypothetical protein
MVVQMRYLVAAICVTWLATMPARADFTGNDVKKFCASQPTGFCLGYIFGSIDTMREYNENHVPVACLPGGATSEQLIAVARKYLDDHPERLHLRGAALIIGAMIQAFPCPKRQ